jgi:hypothetical protein
MHKISTICPLTLNFCRAFFASPGRCLSVIVMLFVSIPGQAQVGLLPPPPSSAAPPVIAPEHDGAAQRKRERQQTKPAEVISEAVNREQVKELTKEDDAKAEAKKNHSLYGFTEFSLLQPKAVVNSGRKNYLSDLTIHVNTYVRAFWNDGPDVVQPWIGVRIAPFAGVGTQGQRTSRFALMYMGPAIGVGSIAQASDPSVDFPVRYGYLLSGGISGLSRLVAADEAGNPSPSDFSPIGWIFDSPGAWSEFRWLRISRGALGFGMMAGVQTGQGKIFYYGGFLFSGFY